MLHFDWKNSSEWMKEKKLKIIVDLIAFLIKYKW